MNTSIAEHGTSNEVQRTSVLKYTPCLVGLVFVLTSCLALAIVTFNFNKIGAANHNLTMQQERLESVLHDAGFSAAIHNYKNYVLRGTPSYYNAAASNLENLDESIVELIDKGQWLPEQIEGLGLFRETMQRYRNNLDVAKAMIDKGITDPVKLDQAIRIDDNPATAALLNLIASMHEKIDAEWQRQREWFYWALLLSGLVIVIGTTVIWLLVVRLDRNQHQLFVSNRALLESQKESAGLVISLKNVNAELTEFSHRVSHDIKAPLRRINIFGGLAKESLGGEDLESSKVYIAQLMDQGIQLSRLVDGLLNLARSDVEDETDVVVQDLRQLINASLQRISVIVDASKAQILVNCTIEQAKVNEFRMAQILDNLLSNACKYGHPDSPEVTVSIEQVENDLLLTVSDNGNGVEKRYQKDLFGLFKRFDPRRAEGTGLGLSIVKRHVEQIGGTINYQDGDPGAVFIVKLPILD